MSKLIISPQTKVGELLNEYPGLEPLLLTLAPAFAALKNPVLRRTVGRVATLSQAAVVGGIKVDELVNRLRAEVGQGDTGGNTEDATYLTEVPPSWFKEDDVADRYDATPVINNGGSPMAEILHRAGSLDSDKILEITSPFVPAPILDILKEKGFKAFSVNRKENVASYLTK